MTTTLPPDVVSSLLAGPAGHPPPGVTPNFENAPSLQTESLVLIAVAMALMFIALAMRLSAHWIMAKTYLLEDLLIVAGSGIICAYYGILNLVIVQYGVGHHIWDQSLHTFIRGLAWINILGILYGPSVILIKVAILTQILRIFAPSRYLNAVMYFSCWGLIIATVIFYALDTILVIAQCSPRTAIWDPFVSGHCITNGIGLYVAASVFNVTSDVLILVLPLPAIYRLHMKLRKKLLIMGLFATGGLACVASIIRLYYTFHVTSAEDVSWVYAPMGIACVYELCIGVIVFCLPVAPRFLQLVRTKFNNSFLGLSRSNSSTSKLANGRARVVNDEKAFAPRRVQEVSLGLSQVGRYLGRQHDVA